MKNKLGLAGILSLAAITGCASTAARAIDTKTAANYSTAEETSERDCSSLEEAAVPSIGGIVPRNLYARVLKEAKAQPQDYCCRYGLLEVEGLQGSFVRGPVHINLRDCPDRGQMVLNFADSFGKGYFVLVKPHKKNFADFNDGGYLVPVGQPREDILRLEWGQAQGRLYNRDYSNEFNLDELAADLVKKLDENSGQQLYRGK